MQQLALKVNCFLPGECSGAKFQRNREPRKSRPLHITHCAISPLHTHTACTIQHCTLHSVHYLHCTLHTVQTVHTIVLCPLYMFYTLCDVQHTCTHFIHCIQCIHCAPHVRCTLYTVHSVHSAHSTLYTREVHTVHCAQSKQERNSRLPVGLGGAQLHGWQLNQCNILQYTRCNILGGAQLATWQLAAKPVQYTSVAL